MSFDTAFELARQVFSYTNHTVMGEALEKWDMELLRSRWCRRSVRHLWSASIARLKCRAS